MIEVFDLSNASISDLNDFKFRFCLLNNEYRSTKLPMKIYFLKICFLKFEISFIN